MLNIETTQTNDLLSFMLFSLDSEEDVYEAARKSYDDDDDDYDDDDF